MLVNMFFLNSLVPNKRTQQWLPRHKNKNFWTKKRPENPGVKRSA